MIDYECKAETELRAAEDVLSGIKSARLTAVQTIINKVYDSIGFNEIRDEELRHLLTIISKEYDLTDYFNTGQTSLWSTRSLPQPAVNTEKKQASVGNHSNSFQYDMTL